MYTRVAGGAGLATIPVAATSFSGIDVL